MTPPGARALAVYVNADTMSTVGLDIDVRDRVVIDDTFATRDLVSGERRSPECWVLALQLERPRLYRGRGRRLRPHALEVPDPHEREAGARDRRGRDRTDVVEARRTRRLRAIDGALTNALGTNADPLIVVGAEPTVTRFLERTRHASRIDGVLRKAPDSDLRALADAIDPVLEDVFTRRQQQALANLEAARRARRARSGIHAVWDAVRRDRGLLVVESSFEQPALHTLDGQLVPTDDRDDPGVIDVVVDDLIELVLAKGGRVEVMPDGSLPGDDGIAFVPDTRPRRSTRARRPG
jgi:hypothetical protein